MRLHSNILTRTDIVKALEAEQAAGRIAASVTFRILTEHSSRYSRRAFEVQLEATSKVEGDGRRHTNGAYVSTPETMGATFDEWGWLISALYRIDPAAVWGTVARPTYGNVHHFQDKTARWYDLQLSISIENTEDDPMPWVTTRNNSTTEPAKPRAGRIGADRRLSDYDRDQLNRHQVAYYVHAPRTADQVRAFAHLVTVSA